jgi:ComF family protein
MIYLQGAAKVVKASLKAALQFLLDLLFPPRCIFCGEIIPPGKKLCHVCAANLPEEKEINLMPIAKNKKQKAFCTYLYAYEGKVRDSLLRYKFEGQKQNASYYAEHLARQVLLAFPETKFDLVTSVPLSHRRQKERGYNQSELIAAHLAKNLNLPYVQCLRKVKQNRTQHLLSRKERVRNVHGVYEPCEKAVLGKHILLVDDIVTTGSTLAECSAQLYKGGAAFVACAAVARAIPE